MDVADAVDAVDVADAVDAVVTQHYDERGPGYLLSCSPATRSGPS